MLTIRVIGLKMERRRRMRYTIDAFHDFIECTRLCDVWDNGKLQPSLLDLLLESTAPRVVPRRTIPP